MKAALSIVAFSMLLIAVPLYAQNQSNSQISEADRAFLQKAAQANLAEIEAGKLAQRRASREDVKQFGQKMAQDHGKTLKELQSIAKKAVTLPTAPDEAHQAQAQMLSRASGKEFDRAYVGSAGVADHKAAKQLLQEASQSKEPDIRAFAQKVLPDIEHHLEMAQKLASDTVGARQ